MSILVSVVMFYTMPHTLSWDLPGDVLAAPAWLERCKLSLSLSLDGLAARAADNSRVWAMDNRTILDNSYCPRGVQFWGVQLDNWTILATTHSRSDDSCAASCEAPIAGCAVWQAYPGPCSGRRQSQTWLGLGFRVYSTPPRSSFPVPSKACFGSLSHM